MGENTPLTRAITTRICKLLKVGVFPAAAMQSQGFSVGAYYRWRNRGEEALEKDEKKLTSDDKIYIDFFKRTEIANAKVEIESTMNIRAIATDPKVDARVRLDAEKFFLSTRFRERWNQSQRLELSGEVEYKVKIPAPSKPKAIDVEFEEINPDDDYTQLENDSQEED